MQHELDRDLQFLFREQTRNLPEEPFLSDTLRLVKKRQARHVLKVNLILLSAVIVCGLLSQFLIKVSVLLSGYLDWIFKAAELFMDRPTGIPTIAFCGVVSLLVFRRRIISAFV